MKLLFSIVMLSVMCGMLNVEAITYGEPDGLRHNNTVLLIMYGDYRLSGDCPDYLDNLGDCPVVQENLRLFRCSGSVLSPNYILTAGHCVEPEAEWYDTDGDGIADHETLKYVKIYFGDKNGEVATENGIPTGKEDCVGDPIHHPEQGKVSWLLTEMGLVKTSKRCRKSIDVVNNGHQAIIPTLGALDDLQVATNDVKMFVNSGFGLQEIVPTFQADLIRYQSTSRFVNLVSANNLGLFLQTNAPAGPSVPPSLRNTLPLGGGSCFGDSGGPTFFAIDGKETTEQAGITSWGVDPNCKANGYYLRTDTPRFQDFICCELGDEISYQPKCNCPTQNSSLLSIGTANGVSIGLAAIVAITLVIVAVVKSSS